jgi:hypothetical protein
MKVSDLQEFFRSLQQPMTASGAKKVAEDLERARAGLEPLKDLGIAEFADFLAKAHKYSQDGIVPIPSKGRAKRAPALDHEKVKTAAQHVQALYEQALDPAFQYTVLEAEVKKLDKQLNKDEAIEVARQLNIAKALKSKKEALAEIRRKIADRRGTLDRVEV